VDQQSGVLGRGVLLHCVTRQAQPPHDKGRALPPGTQALMALVYLRKGETFAEPAAGSPRLGTVLRRARADGLPYLISDGTLIEIERVAADRPFYSGKRRRHGVNLQVLAGPAGTLLWVSGELRGAVHDLTVPASGPMPSSKHNAI
jgi:hypothetical protein